MKYLMADLEAHGYNKNFLSLLSALIFSPGFYLIFLFRIYHFFYRKTILGKVLSKILWRFSVLTTGCHISPTALIGPGIFFPHPIGIVIGNHAKIGKNCTIYQNTTLGIDKNGNYPELGEDIIIYANSVLIGGIKIENGCIIGAMSFLNKSMSENSIYKNKK